MNEMSREFDKHIGSYQNEKVVELYREVRQYLQEAWSEDPDLEAVFTVIEDLSREVKLRDVGFTATYICRAIMKEKTGKDPGNLGISGTRSGISDTAKELRQEFEDYVKQQCWIKDSSLDRISMVYADFFTKIAGPIGVHTSAMRPNRQKCLVPSGTSIYTTNYDLCLEWFFMQHLKGDLVLNLGFDFDKKSNLNVFRPDMLRQPNLKLVKLHGSLDWFLNANGDVTRETSPPSKTYVKRDVLGEVMIYPIQEKALYMEPYFTMFRLLKDELRNAKHWIVIGHRFNDPVIRQIFFESYSSEKRVILVSPEAKQIEEKLHGISLESISDTFGLNPQVNDQIAKLIQ